MTTITNAGAGGTNIVTLGTVSTGTYQGTPVPITAGGSGANLTASIGGIVYSTASAMAILAGTATANKMLLSQSSTAPIWSTPTWPNTIAANSLIYASSANVMAALATANTAILTTDSSGNVQWLTGGLTVAYGGTGATTWSTYSIMCGGTTSAGVMQQVSGVGSAGQTLQSAGASALPVWANPTLLFPVNQNSSSVAMAKGNMYIINNGASLVTLTLPATAAIGDSFMVMGQSSGGWKIAQNSGQIIYGATSGTHTTSGATGTLSSADQYNCVTVVCIVANTTFVAEAPLNSALSYA